MTVERDDQASYSPRRLRFLWLHYEALESGDCLTREWALVREDRRPVECMCRELNEHPAPARSPGNGSTGSGSYVHGAQIMRADMDVAAHALNYSVAFLVDLSQRCLLDFEQAITERDREEQAKRRALLVTMSVRMAHQLGWRAAEPAHA